MTRRANAAKDQEETVSDEERAACKVCGAKHGMLETLPQECFDAIEPASEERIRAALDEGRRAADMFLGYPVVRK